MGINEPEIVHGTMYHGGIPINEIKESYEKIETMCIIASSKCYLPGHRLRHELIKKILKSDLDISIYGRGLEPLYSGDPRIKYAIENKQDAYGPCKYTLAIENVFYGFFTEKICEPILCECLPLYAGCENPYIDLTDDTNLLVHSNIDKMFDMIKTVYNDGGALYEKHLPRITKARQDMLDIKTTLPEFLHKTFNEQ
jgi:hypothetical protein